MTKLAILIATLCTFITGYTGHDKVSRQRDILNPKEVTEVAIHRPEPPIYYGVYLTR